MAPEQCSSCPYILWSLTGRVLYVGHALALGKAENYNAAEGTRIAILQTRSFIFGDRLSLARNALAYPACPEFGGGDVLPRCPECATIKESSGGVAG